MMEQKSRLKQVFDVYWPFLVFFLGMAFLHLWMPLIRDDLEYHSKVLEGGSSLGFLLDRLKDNVLTGYQSTSARVIVNDLFAPIFSRFFWLYKLVNPILFTMIGVLLSKIFWKDDSTRRSANICIVLFLLIFPFSDLYGAGWVCCSTNYLWPICFGLIVVYGLKKLLIEEKRIPVIGIVGLVLSLLIAINMEPVCVIMVFLLLTAFLYSIKQKRAYGLVGFLWLLSVGMLAVDLTCPGIAGRIAQETAAYFPTFMDLSIFAKIHLGLYGLLRSITWYSLVFFVFSLFVACLVWQKSKNIGFRIISVLPAFYFLIVAGLQQMNIPVYQHMMDGMYYWNVLVQHHWWLPFTVDIWLSILCLCVIISLYAIFQSIPKTAAMTGILGLGFITKAMLGASASVFMSGERTMAFFSACIIIVMIFLLQTLDLKRDETSGRVMVLFSFPAVYQLTVLAGTIFFLR